QHDMTLFFFFQAEDGIRDWSVTGVQTCALPICHGALAANRSTGASFDTSRPRIGSPRPSLTSASFFASCQHAVAVTIARARVDRSEERRVGKEWRSRWARGQ